MIRLAVNGPVEVWDAVSVRLRGATIASCYDPGGRSLSPEAFDALLIVEPDQAALSAVNQALAHQKPVLITPSPALSLDVLEQFTQAARQLGVPLVIANPDRYLPSRQLIQQQLSSGKLGRPGLIRIHRWEARGGLTQTPTGIPVPLLLEMDLAAWLMGGDPDLIYATSPAPPARPVSHGQTIQVHLGFPEGGMVLIDYSSALPPGDGYRYLSVMGSLGAAYADDQQNRQLLYQGQHAHAVAATEGLSACVNLAQDFVDSLGAGRDQSPSLLAWTRAVRMGQAVERSLSTRQAVSLEGL